MSVESKFKHANQCGRWAGMWAHVVGMVAGVGLVLGAGNVCARDWVEVLTTPFVDPLRVGASSRANAGRAAPWEDSQSPGCENRTVHDASDPLTLLAAIDLTLCHSPQVQEAWASIKVQTAQVGEARAAYLPTVNAGVSRTRQKSQSPESGFMVNSERTTDSQFATLTWRLLDFGGRGANARSAQALLEAAVASRDAVLQKTMASVISLYFEAQTAKANRETKEKGENVARQTLEAARKREARGAGAQSDTLQARTALAKAELEHGRAIGAYDKSVASLVVAMGLPARSVQALVLAPDYSDVEHMLGQDLDTWLSLAYDQHPALMAVRAQLESARDKLNAVRSEGRPTLDLTWSQYVNGRPNQALTSGQSNESTVGLTVNIPLFEGFGRSYKLSGAQAQIEVKDSELRDTQNQILGEVVKSHADAVAALRNLDASKRLIEAAQEALDNVQKKYDRGVVDILEMLSVQMALTDSELERVRSLSDWRSARLRLLANVGTVGIKDVRVKN